MNESGSRSTLSLDQWVALNDEMAALVRAGVPLDRTLADFARGWPRRMRQVVEQLTARMQAGDTLPQALDRSGAAFPPVYRAVVAAGLRSGRLAAALEQLSATAKRAAELRRIVGFSLLYPLFVVTLAYAVFCFMIAKVTPFMMPAIEHLTDTSSVLRERLVWASEHFAWWAPWLPIVTTIGLACWWWRSARASWGVSARRWPAHHARGGWPTPGTVLRCCRQATFAELLALLLEHTVPMPEAVELAAAATGDHGLRSAAETLAAQLRGGVTAATHVAAPAGIPPLIGWLILTADRQPRLVETLRASAETCRQDAMRGSRWFNLYLPPLLTVILGGTAVLLYALFIFVPFCQLMLELGQP